MDLAGQDILVLGLGITGRSAARFCAARGARVLAVDERPADQLGNLKELGDDVEVLAGSAFPASCDFDVVVPSPGIPPSRYREGARKVWGDIELAGRALDVPIAAVTGTNGKSTTVLLIAAMLRATGFRAEAAGNVGRPALSLVGEAIDVAVLEVSSFQLEAVDAFRPDVAVVLNLSPDHLDRHGDFEGYASAKEQLLRRQESHDTAILNFDDDRVRAMANATRARVVPLSMRRPYEGGAWLDTGSAVLPGPVRVALDDLALPGTHNRQNAIAALAAAQALGADPARAVLALADFRGLPHRSEIVGTLAGVTFVNDSKATNPGAAAQALQGFTEPIVWIAGGSDKSASFEALADVAVRRSRYAVLTGPTAPAIERALAGRIESTRAASLEDAVGLAAKQARPGEIVLLAPACASFDAFRSYEERGDCFRRAVDRLAASGAAQ